MPFPGEIWLLRSGCTKSESGCILKVEAKVSEWEGGGENGAF